MCSTMWRMGCVCAAWARQRRNHVCRRLSPRYAWNHLWRIIRGRSAEDRSSAWRSPDASSLDANLRVEMQHELKALQQDLGITFLFVTHDQSEALAISDRVVLLHRG